MRKVPSPVKIYSYPELTEYLNILDIITLQKQVNVICHSCEGRNPLSQYPNGYPPARV